MIKDEMINYPLFFYPIYKSYIWGGEKISRLRSFSTTTPIAESWEICDRIENQSVVYNGSRKGYTLRELLDNNFLGFLSEKIPLLVKLIDAKENLSIQVHPSKSKERKTEAWIVLEAEKNAAVYAGNVEGVTKKEVEKALGTEKILPLLEKIPVKKGDVIYLPSGTIHAILSGCFLLEVQQNSNTTYRVYDWGRCQNKRPLHISEAKQSFQIKNKKELLPKKTLLSRGEHFSVELLLNCPFFQIKKWTFKEQVKVQIEKKHLCVLFSLYPDCEIIKEKSREKLIASRICLIPPHWEEFSLCSKKKIEVFEITCSL